MRVFFLASFFYMMLFGVEIEFDTLKSKFKQTVRSLEGSKIEYSGDIYIKLPTNVLWIYKRPTEKKIFADNYKIISYEPLLEQATIINISKAQSLVDILQNAKKVKDSTYRAKVDDIEYIIKLDSNSLPKEISYSDKLKNRVLIEFIDAEKNIEFEKEIFKPNLPNGTDIIR